MAESKEEIAASSEDVGSKESESAMATHTALRFVNLIGKASHALVGEATDQMSAAWMKKMEADKESLLKQVDELNVPDHVKEKFRSTVSSATASLGAAGANAADAVSKANNSLNKSLSSVVQTGLENAEKRGATSAQRRGVMDALHWVLELLEEYSAIPPFQALRAVFALGVIQEISFYPYPPPYPPISSSHNAAANSTKLLLGFAGNSSNAQLLERLRITYQQTIAAYPVEEVAYFQDLLKAGVHSREELIQSLTGVDTADILDAVWDANVNKPVNFLFLDHARKWIVLTVRATTELKDILTDACFATHPEYGSHKGMQEAADWIDAFHRSKVEDARAQFPSYDVILSGHSLGGGVATLLAVKWLKDRKISGPDPNNPKLYAYSFGSPCVLVKNIARKYDKHITSVMYGRDIVARASWGTGRRLLATLSHLSGVPLKKSPDSGGENEREQMVDATLKNDQYAKIASENPKDAEFLNSVRTEWVVQRESEYKQLRSSADGDSKAEESNAEKMRGEMINASQLVERLAPPTDCLYPAGRTLLVVPVEDIEEKARRDVPAEAIYRPNGGQTDANEADESDDKIPVASWSLGERGFGGCVVFDLGEDVLKVCEWPVISQTCIDDHLIFSFAKAIGVQAHRLEGTPQSRKA